MVAGGEVIEHRRRRLGPLHQPAQKLRHPLLEAHAVGEAVLVGLEPLALERIVQSRRLQIFEPLLLLQPLALKGQLLGSRPLQGRRRRLPKLKGLAGGFQQPLVALNGRAIQPAALQTGAGQLLALALDGEIEQQGPQLKHLGATDDDAIEAIATAEAAL